MTPRRWRPPRPLAPCLYVLMNTTVNQEGSLSLVSRLRPFDKLGHKKLDEHALYRLPRTRRDPPTHMPSTTIAQGARKPLEVDFHRYSRAPRSAQCRILPIAPILNSPYTMSTN